MTTIDQRNVETDLRDAAAARGATVQHLGNGHFQIRGRLLVNYYPWSKKRSAYVAATTHGVNHISPTEAVAMAFSAPPIVAPTKKDSRHGHPKRQRARLIRKNGANCHWCQVRLTVGNSTVEHVIPLYRGGLDNANNRVLACKPCNQARGHEMPELQK